MTPKERAVAALGRQKPDDIVPTMEIEFQLYRELLGSPLILGEAFAAARGMERERAVEHNVRLYCELAERLDYSAVTVDPLYWEFGHGVGTRFFYASLEDQLEVVRALRPRAENRFLIAASVDGTFGIPLAEDFEDFAFAMYDDPQTLHRLAEEKLHRAMETIGRLVDAGVELIYSCSDYCFGSAPFFSPLQFEEFVHPYLQRQTEEIRRAGAFCIKHTDGNISAIAEMLVSCRPHAIHSIDPMAGMDIAEFIAAYGDRVAVMGNVNVAHLQNGDTQAIVASARQALTAGKEAGGYIFSTCNTVFSTLALEHYQTMLGVRAQLGKYPASTDKAKGEST